ncbi:MAG: AAA domain-containing protein [Methylococcales bacterium]|jgi:hypothetical protein|nr:AAA domain-containing protein [Methylococcales bacterium]MBT7410259.1 AAA domain-containing protein [Methylococcales bacterium]
MRPSQISLVLKEEFNSISKGHHTPIMIWGAPGAGKSQIVLQVAEQHQVPLIDIRLSQMEPSDLRGIPFRVDNNVEWAIPSMLPDKQKHGESGILFLDEINAAPPSVSASAYQLILDRRLGNYEVPTGWIIVAAGNRQSDRGVTYTMPAPLANRFSHFDFDIHLDDWVMWAYEHNIDDRIIAFLRFRPELLFDFDPEHNPIAFPSPRSWEFAHRALQKFGHNKDILTGTFQACIGLAAGIELAAFVEHLDKLPEIEKILSGDSQIVPTEIDLQYAVATSLIAHCIRLKSSPDREVTLGHILNYASCFPQKEMGIMLVSDLHRAIGQDLFSIAEFSPWAKSIADVMLY